MTNTEDNIIMTMSKFIELRDRAHGMAVEKGWHEEEHSDEHFLMLVITEVAEAVEAYRENEFDAWGECPDCGSRVVYDTPEGPSDDEHCGDRAGFVCPSCGCSDPIQGPKPCGVGSELADVVIRLLDLSGLRGVSVEDSIRLVDAPPVGMTMDVFKSKTFVEMAMMLTVALADAVGSLDFYVSIAIEMCAWMAYMGDIDLMESIENKMAFNATRSRRHGGKLA